MEKIILLFLLLISVLYLYGAYMFFDHNHVCIYESDCVGCTTCMNGKCMDYRVGEPCFSKKVEDDASLYYEYNYGMSADLVNMKCFGEHFSAIMANSKRPVRDMTNVEYRKTFKGLVKRSDRCNGEFWAFGRFEEDGIKRKTLVERIREKDKLLVKAIHKLNNTINIYTLWVIPTYKRAWTLDLVLKSLGKRNILVSKDSLSNEIDNVIQQYNVESIEHPWSCSIHPNQFPAKDESLNKGYNGDTYGNPRSPWATCLKHHWWWMMKQAWSRNPDRVCVLEDDTILHPQAFDWLYNHKGNIKLTPEAIAVPWCMDRKIWNRIEPKSFCEHDDYNWDQTIAWMLEHGHGPNLAAVPSVPLSMHIGDCGGWDAGGRNKDCNEKTIAKIKKRVDNWLKTRLSVTTKTVKWLAAHSKPNGGWGHPKDWAHCMGDSCLKWIKEGGCFHHVLSDAWMCQFDWMSINTDDIRVSKGGSNIEDVLHRQEDVEFIQLNDGAIGIPYIPRGPKHWHHKKLIYAATTKKHQCEQTIKGTTLFFERIEYANLWHTMNDWFNVHWTLETLGNPSEVTIVWLDGHAWGHLDAAWKEIFYTDTKYISEYSGSVCFEKVVWVPKNTPVWNTEMPSERCGIMDRFVQRVFSAYGITPSLTEDVVIDRKDYMAHPRHKSGIKTDRIIEHLDQMFPSSTVIQLETMTFKEQVKLIANAKRLRGVHGAGLTHLIWLPDGAEVVEWVAPSHANVKLFEHIASWRPNILYSRANMPSNHHLTILIPFREKIYDKKSQGSGREKNLKDWLEYMSSFLKIPADVIVVEQSQEGTFNKGFLFNVGFSEAKNSDYFVLHDVDQIPENPLNDYSFKKRPTHLLTSTSQWGYKKGPTGNVGGALMITRDMYKIVNGYSNKFGGWGREDDNMALRINKHGGYDVLPMHIGKYKELKHPRVFGLDKNEQFHKNIANTNDFISGLSDLKYEIMDSTTYIRGILHVRRIKVQKQKIAIPENIKETIKTSDLFAAIDYNAPENKGPWKQGWNYDYDGRFKDGLTIHVVPHSHNDPGWIKTYHNYYSTQTKHILNTVVESLIKRSTATFIWAEISYFSLWWKDATEQQKHQVKELVKQKRLDFVTGGWVMNDEACVTDRAIRWQLEEGLQWLQEHLGIRPQYSWAIDPFGHSAGQAHILKEMGYKGMLIQRVHYAIKKQLAKKQQLEFQWSTPAGNIFTHMMPFYSYDGPHTCGPDPSICCQFDFKRIGAGTSWLGCPWGTPPVSINEENVKEKSLLWLDQVYKKAMLYKNKHVLIPLGDDFRYQNMQEADRQFENYQKMFDWIHKHVPNVQASFSTLTHYFDSVVNNDVPTLEGSFFPYSDREKDYWTGYFNSRIFYKGYDRKLEATIAAAEKLCPDEDLHLEKQALALFQHHDGITGTAKSHVVQDYYNTMKTAVESANAKIKKALNVEGPVSVNPLNMKTPTHKPNEIKPFEGEPECKKTIWKSNYVEFDNGFLFAVNHVNVKERFVWRTNQGTAGAYLLSVSDVEIPLEVHSFESCETEDYIEMRTTFDMVTRVLRVYHDKTIEVIFEVDIRSRNNGELWAVYSIVDAKKLCSDVHGLTWECHSEPNAPLQAKFWPMPTMAWLENEEHKMTWITGQPTGVGFDKGKMIMILDRRGNRDDARGLGQGVTDTVAVDMRFGLLMNEEHEKALRVREWILNPRICIL